MKISIITTTYNSKDTIASTIESVMNQNYPDIDYWIIDGGSTDGTLDIVNDYQQQYPYRINCISDGCGPSSCCYIYQGGRIGNERKN